MNALITAGLVVVKNRKLLLAFSKNKKAWYLPGGKTDNGETTRFGLVREIKEELNIMLNPDQLKFYTHISVQAFGERDNLVMEQDCFLCEMDETPKPAAEIEALDYFTTKGYSTLPAQVPGVVMVMAQLKNDNLID